MFGSVIASEAKQSIDPRGKHGLLRRFAPRNDGERDAYRCGEPLQFSMMDEDFRPQSQPTRPLLRATSVYTISE
jgi:hypothetical protein